MIIMKLMVEINKRQIRRATGVGIKMGGLKAVAVITGGESSVKGSLQFFQEANGVTHVSGKITGLKPGLHGFHIHALGDTTNGCISTGIANVSIEDKHIPLIGQHSILGRAVVIHADPDDLGRGGHELSKTTGNAGARVGCGVIGLQSSV
ncbi:superoxide dismutase [Cu-Zn] 2 isoform X2 [Lactuca sativa]|uniref:superoxide dismutase [Cu-Zn] 2 isoform X2 n=1 Tax=Lactuca sativa TaxID=4236 RepID=UPI000CD8B030|nr:superoxide dismutase [Cu-Zn] 2 isoform X2 [Lactuca sativa]